MVEGIDFVQMKWYALEETQARNGKTLKKLTFVYKETSSDEFITYLLPKLQHFAKHNFQARWQDKHFKAYVKSFLENSIVYGRFCKELHFLGAK
jgi:hypothetical protein